MKTVKILPTTSYSASNSPAPVDGWLTKEFLKYGGPAAVLREGIDFPDLDFPDINGKNTLLLVKTPGSDVHHFPEGMRDLGQEIANHQYSVSPAARDKVCALRFRKATLVPDKKLAADFWHGHTMPPNQMRSLRAGAFIIALVTQGAFCPRLLGLSRDMSLNEYILSDIEPTFIQSAAATEDLAVKQLKAGLGCDNENAIPKIRSPEKSLVFLTSRVFHRAPGINDFAPENIGKERKFMDVVYMPTNKAKKLLPPLIGTPA